MLGFFLFFFFYKCDDVSFSSAYLGDKKNQVRKIYLLVKICDQGNFIYDDMIIYIFR